MTQALPQVPASLHLGVRIAAEGFGGGAADGNTNLQAMTLASEEPEEMSVPRESRGVAGSQSDVANENADQISDLRQEVFGADGERAVSGGVDIPVRREWM